MSRARFVSLVVMLLGVGLLVLLAFLDFDRALFSYTAAFAFCVSIALGALVLIQVLDVGHAVWSIPLRRLLEATMGTMPLYLVLFLPLLIGYRRLYPWAHVGLLADEQVKRQVASIGSWYAPGFFAGRAYFYLLVWTGVALALRRASVAQDEQHRVELTDRQRWISAATLPLVGLTLTFASFDWFMSLVPGWSSDLYGIYFFAGGFAGAVGVFCVTTWAALRAAVLPRPVGSSHVSAVGRVQLTAVILWSYIAAASLILIWIGDLPREIRFYAERVAHGWAWVSGLLIFGHFLVPFLVLLSRPLKRNAATLAIAGAWVVLMHAFDAYWLVAPSSGRAPHVLDVGAFLALGGAAVAWGLWQFGRARPFPVAELDLERSLRYESE